MHIRRALSSFVAPLLIALTAAALRAQDFSQVEIKTIPVANNVYMLKGVGGNMAVSVGDDGTLLVDADNPIPGLADKIAAAAGRLREGPIRLLINTHWHFDHVGGNEAFRKAGALIVAHENVLRRMSEKQRLGHIERDVPPSPPGALPMLTFGDELILHWNGDLVRIIHFPGAHTDGDSFVFFTKANVIHLGDTFFSGMYPFIDINAGGSIDGMIAAADKALTLVNDETKIIPGHGPLSSVDDLRAFRQMLMTSRERVQALIDAGKSRDEAVAAQPTHDLDARWGQVAFKPDQWTAIVYDSLKRR